MPLIFSFIDRKDAKSLPPSSDNADSVVIQNNFLKEIYTTVLIHNAVNPFNTNFTCLFCTIEGDASPISVRNIPRTIDNDGVHAEKRLITRLNKNTEVKKSKNRSCSDPDLNITVYINNSPCSDKRHDCKKELTMFLKENKKVHMFIYITSIFKVHRESCRKHRHSPTISDETHYEASAELWNLMQHDRCTISAYSKNVWGNLFDLAEESKEPLERYGEIVFKNQDVSREDEDKRIKEDLVYIGTFIIYYSVIV